MKAWWTRISTRIDALSLRERVVLFLTLLVLVMLLAEILWIGPLQARHQQLSQNVATQAAELKSLQDELNGMGSEAGPGQLVREELAQVRARLAEVNQEIAQMPLAKADGTPLPKVLVHFLRRHEGLVLVRTRTLESSSLVAVLGMSRRGLELTVAGPYHELTRYVQTLEQALPTLRWGTMRMNSERQPAELTLQVWLLGATP